MSRLFPLRLTRPKAFDPFDESALDAAPPNPLAQKIKLRVSDVRAVLSEPQEPDPESVPVLAQGRLQTPSRVCFARVLFNPHAQHCDYLLYSFLFCFVCTPWACT